MTGPEPERIFGQILQDKVYTPRPGAYAIIFNAQNDIGLVKSPEGYVLPGGGIEGDETPETCLTREILEETGWQIHPSAKLGIAGEYCYSQELQMYLYKICYFYYAHFFKVSTFPSEKDHHPFWVKEGDVLAFLKNPCHRWAFESYLARRR